MFIKVRWRDSKWWKNDLALRCSGWSSFNWLLSTAIRTSSKLWTAWCSTRFGGSILDVDFFISLSLVVIRRLLDDEASDGVGVTTWSTLFFFGSEETESGFSSLHRWFNRNGGWRPASRLVIDSVVGVGVPLGVPRLLSWLLRRHTLHRQKDCPCNHDKQLHFQWKPIQSADS